MKKPLGKGRRGRGEGGKGRAWGGKRERGRKLRSLGVPTTAGTLRGAPPPLPPPPLPLTLSFPSTPHPPLFLLAWPRPCLAAWCAFRHPSRGLATRGKPPPLATLVTRSGLTSPTPHPFRSGASGAMGVSLLLQKRLAASVLKCGKRKIWLDPNEVNEISMANSSKSYPTSVALLAPWLLASCVAGASRILCGGSKLQPVWREQVTCAIEAVALLPSWRFASSIVECNGSRC